MDCYHHIIIFYSIAIHTFRIILRMGKLPLGRGTRPKVVSKIALNFEAFERAMARDIGPMMVCANGHKGLKSKAAAGNLNSFGAARCGMSCLECGKTIQFGKALSQHAESQPSIIIFAKSLAKLSYELDRAKVMAEKAMNESNRMEDEHDDDSLLVTDGSQFVPENITVVQEEVVDNNVMVNNDVMGQGEVLNTPRVSTKRSSVCMTDATVMKPNKATNRIDISPLKFDLPQDESGIPPAVLESKGGIDQNTTDTLQAIIAEQQKTIEAMKEHIMKLQNEMTQMKETFHVVVEAAAAEVKAASDKSKVSTPNTMNDNDEFTHLKTQSTEKSDKGQGMSDKGEGDSDTQNTWAKVAATPGRVPLTKTQERLVRQSVTPFKAPPKVEKLHFKWHTVPSLINNRKGQFEVVRLTLQRVGIRNIVRDYSLIGNSILELYVNIDNLEEVRTKMAKYVKQDTYVPLTNIESFNAGKLNKEETIIKAERRVTVLCARNLSNAMRTCILKNINVTSHARILAEASELRKQWDIVQEEKEKTSSTTNGTII